MRKNYFLAFGIFLMAACFCYSPREIQAASSGDCIINEFMANPSGADTDKEWVEVFNASGAEINLNGWVINDGSNRTISGSSTIPVGGYAVICRNANAAINGGVDCDYIASIALVNSGDRNLILLDNSGLEIDRVSYADGDIVEGASRYFDGLSWQNSVSGPYNDVDKGTPGAVNPIVEDEELEAEKTGNLNANVQLTLLDVGVLTEQDTAKVSFNVNAIGAATVQYGPTVVYGQNKTASVVVGDNEISLSDLDCGTTYHYRVSVSSGGETVLSDDSTFEIVCGVIDIDALNMTKSVAKADNTFEHGWEWIYDVTIWNEDDNALQMKFGQWSDGVNNMTSAQNVRFSVDGGTNWTEISGNDSYSALVSVVDGDAARRGIQTRIIVQTKIPKGTVMGAYGANYSIRAE